MTIATIAQSVRFLTDIAPTTHPSGHGVLKANPTSLRLRELSRIIAHCMQDFIVNISDTTWTELFAAVAVFPVGLPGAGREVSFRDDPCHRYRLVVLAKVPVWMSVDEFLNWDSGDALKCELVDGEPRAMALANRTHGILQGRLATLINGHLDREKALAAWL